MKNTIKRIQNIVESNFNVDPMKDDKLILAHVLCAQACVYSDTETEVKEINLEKSEIVESDGYFEPLPGYQLLIRETMLTLANLIVNAAYSIHFDIHEIREELIDLYKSECLYFSNEEHFEGFIQWMLDVTTNLIIENQKEIQINAKFLVVEGAISGLEYNEDDLIEFYEEENEILNN
jgi:hypothetical protein